MTDIPHGTISGYQYHHCRCNTCRDARLIYAREAIKRKAARLAAYPDSRDHGAIAAYNCGCRCNPCREAYRLYSRQLRARHLTVLTNNPADRRHGTEYGYRCGCRCTPCSLAKRAKNKITNKAFVQRRKAEHNG